MCYIADGKNGACDRYANHDGQIVRLDPLTILDRRMAAGDSVKPFLGANWDGGFGQESELSSQPLVPAQLSDYKPAPFIVSRDIEELILSQSSLRLFLLLWGEGEDRYRPAPWQGRRSCAAEARLSGLSYLGIRIADDVAWRC